VVLSVLDEYRWRPRYTCLWHRFPANAQARVTIYHGPSISRPAGRGYLAVVGLEKGRLCVGMHGFLGFSNSG
jgi:hypothetical protein